MALGDELVRTDNATEPVGEVDTTGLVPLTPELEENVEVRSLGDSVGTDTTETPNMSEKVNFEAPSQATGPLAQRVLGGREEVPEDNAKTPPGTPSPEEGKRLGDAIKKAFEAVETPGATEALRQAGLDVRAAPAAPPKPTLEDVASNVPDRVEGPTSRKLQQAGQNAQQAQNQGLGQQILNALQNRDVQRGLVNLGKAISPEGTVGQQLAQFGNRFISGEAQEEFQRRLQQGQPPAEAAQQTDGLTAEDRQTVLQQFRAERQREFERESTRTEQERKQRLTEAQIEEIKAGIRQDDRKLDQEATRIAIAQSRLSNEEERLAIDKLNAQAEREATRALARLRDAQAALTSTKAAATAAGATGQGAGGDQFNDLINNTDQVLGRLQNEIEFLNKQAKDTRGQIRAIQNNFGRFADISEERKQELLKAKQRKLSTIRRNISTLQNSRQSLNQELSSITDALVNQGQGNAAESDSTATAGGEGGEPGSTRSNPVVVKSKEEFEQVPPGTYVKTPNGPVKIKQ